MALGVRARPRLLGRHRALSARSEARASLGRDPTRRAHGERSENARAVRQLSPDFRGGARMASDSRGKNQRLAHTPGTWEAWQPEGSNGFWWAGPREIEVCTVWGPQAEANARLIAAAPALADALEKVCAAMEAEGPRTGAGMTEAEAEAFVEA